MKIQPSDCQVVEEDGYDNVKYYSTTEWNRQEKYFDVLDNLKKLLKDM